MSTIAAPSFGPLSAPELRVKRTTGPAPRASTLTGGFAGLREFRFPFEGGEFVVQLAGSPPAWVAPTIEAVGRLLSLPHNWDSYGARPVDPACVAAALEVVRAIMRDNSPAPSVVPTVRGGIQLEWHMRDIDLEVEIASPSRVAGYFEDHRSAVSWECDLSFNLKPLADAISNLSRR